MVTTDASPALNWQFESQLSRYRSPTTGRFIGSAQITQLRNDFLDARTATVADLAGQLASGDLTVSAWETAMRTEIKTTLGVEYVFGRGGLSNMQPADWDTLSTLVVSQFNYLNAFAGAVADGTLSEAEITARAAMYIGSGTAAYERGAASASGVDLPCYPGDDCEGRTNCRCSWQLSTAEDGSIEAFWICEDDSNSCQPCLTNADQYNPWTPD